MPKIKSIFHNICMKIAAIPIKLTKSMYRNFVIITIGAVAITVVSFTNTGFGAGGKNVVMAHLSAGAGSDYKSEEEPDKLMDGQSLSDSLLLNNEIALFVVSDLEEALQEKQEQNIRNQESIDKVKKEIEEAERIRRLEEEKERKRQKRKELLGIEVLSEEDYNNMLRIVESEAGVCDLKGKILVANVVINRVRSSKFPNNISEVIFSPHQFSPVSNGTFYSCVVSKQTIEAVERALDGEDYSEGALFFMQRVASNPKAVRWFDSSLKYLFYHDGHEFFKY